ncbi:uncharacterized protein LOC124945028 [Impatiens glandulifera]|uniref:uncharacterized protein LOC124945028 n=1 Tax=Impatiens glandulifera TaxID=253017 RepID=UPI001FB0841E|nr:uncharacterized protein LOC124945028 [Impatiens glandulifera]XP_047341348.1 uncharacterized protein LOC124945028 [Impatiens glandulifera]XP_047341349.1 uncharacterized protein LOC124945028 [Impatiens glandulifera]XP_047341350.1 uncharacterized protein LOC124945028 [Impatiens glandulifera]
MIIAMDTLEESSRLGSLRGGASLRNLSSSSSAFCSAKESPFFSPKSPTTQASRSLPAIPEPQSLTNVRLSSSNGSVMPAASTSSDIQNFDEPSPSPAIPNGKLSCYGIGCGNEYQRQREKQKKVQRFNAMSFTTNPIFSSNRPRSSDVYIGFNDRKPLLIRFTNWLRAELEAQGVSCFVTDRSRCRNSRKHGVVEKAMDVCSYGVIILTRKSFRNPYTIEELLFFAGKKNLVPIYFDLSPDDCLVRDIVERRGELWEKYGGEVWLVYGGVEKEWRDAINSLLHVDEWKLEAHDGNWRDCILQTVTLLALRLGRRSVVDRITRWREKLAREEFVLSRNENFVGRKKELSELEFMLFGDVITGEAEKDYFEIKAKQRRRKNTTIGGHRKGKEPVVWKESEKEIEMQNAKAKTGGRRKRSTKIVYGKGIACVSGESGIGKTELLLEFAYRFHQRYKSVLWVGGESRYIRQNYLNLWQFLEVDVGVENVNEKSRIKSFEEQEESAIARIRKELMRNIPFLIVIDNLENEKDWWDRKLIMDLLPRFGGETHILISTNLSRVMNLETLKLEFLSEIEAMSLMQGNLTAVSYPVSEIDALRVIEAKLGRLTLGFSIVGAILSELPITPSRLLDTINRMPIPLLSENNSSLLRRNNLFLLQLFEVCFSIFDHADGSRSLATRMVQASGWFSPEPIPVSLLAMAAFKIPDKHRHTRTWKKLVQSLACGGLTYVKKSEEQAGSILLRFNIARRCSKEGRIQIHDVLRAYTRRRGGMGVAKATVQAVVSRGSIAEHSEQIWGACFLLFGFGNDPIVVDLKVSDMLFLVREVVLPLAIKAFVTFSRCRAGLELLRLCTDALEAVDEAFLAPVEKWLDRSLCWKPIQTSAQLNPCLWQELALSRATVLETRAKLMMRGGLFDIGDDLIRKAIFIRSAISGEDHPGTVAARETLSKLTRLLSTFQMNSSP